jgi:alpha-N-arabinofuranosidase
MGERAAEAEVKLRRRRCRNGHAAPNLLAEQSNKLNGPQVPERTLKRIERLLKTPFLMKPTYFALVVFGLLPLLAASASDATEYHVSPAGNDETSGTLNTPLRTIGAAARLALPGDIITVHAGVYRERVAPPRGGSDDAHRITYQAAPGEKVVITGSEPARGWKKVSGDTWEITIANRLLGAVNPFDELIYGSWFEGHGQPHHTGNVYLNGQALKEAFAAADVLKPAGSPLLWYAKADGNGGPVLMNVLWIKPAGQKQVNVDDGSAEGGDAAIYLGLHSIAFGYLKDGSRLYYNAVDFGAGSDSLDINAASLAQGGFVELHLDGPDGPLLGSCRVTNTGDWLTFKTFTIPFSKKVSGKQNLCFVLKAPPVKPDGVTIIQAQFPAGTDPNKADVEISVRHTVFYPEKTGINYITVRGLTLCNAATNWAPPSAEQVGLIGPHWSRSWIIENNTILNSRCSGISLGRPTYGHAHHYQTLHTRVYPEAGSGQTVEQLEEYFEHGSWDKEAAGHHIVRNNSISFCGQTGIVGCSGGAFSLIEGNDIHDIDCNESYNGEEMACIKLHFAIDTVIRNNHLYRCLGSDGLWLDWGTQGVQVDGNLFHDNKRDLAVEVSHGPLVVANNLFLSKAGPAFISQGIAFAHNLVAGSMKYHGDKRLSFYYKPHDSVSLGKHDNPSGDIRWLNNIFGGSISAGPTAPTLPVVFAGNVYIAGSSPSGPIQPWLMNMEWIKPQGASAVRAAAGRSKNGTQVISCDEGGQSVGRIRSGDWLSFDQIKLDANTSAIDIRAAADIGYGGVIELHADKPDGALLGTCDVASTGGWQKWSTFTASIKPASGMKRLCLVFLPAARDKRADDADSSMVLPNIPEPALAEKPDGWYLTFTQYNAWRTATPRALVTTNTLGKAVIPNLRFENADGSPLKIDTDYFGRMRNTENPSPGPFETTQNGEQTLKVWPKPVPR